jgi:hypothetical protein
MRTSGVAQSVGPEFKPSTKKKLKKKGKDLPLHHFYGSAEVGANSKVLLL